MVTAGFFLVLFLLFFVTGFSAAAVYKRFGMLYLTVILIGLAALVAVGLIVVGRWASSMPGVSCSPGSLV